VVRGKPSFKKVCRWSTQHHAGGTSWTVTILSSGHPHNDVGRVFFGDSRVAALCQYASHSVLPDLHVLHYIPTKSHNLERNRILRRSIKANNGGPPCPVHHSSTGAGTHPHEVPAPLVCLSPRRESYALPGNVLCSCVQLQVARIVCSTSSKSCWPGCCSRLSFAILAISARRASACRRSVVSSVMFRFIILTSAHWYLAVSTGVQTSMVNGQRLSIGKRGFFDCGHKNSYQSAGFAACGRAVTT
jgi:hypothetical protein